MDHRNRSPCPPRRLMESARPAPLSGASLRESRQPERANVTLREETRDGQSVTLIDVAVATVDRVNRNGRLYPRPVWEAAITAAQPDLGAGRLWGLLEHPEDGWDNWDPLKGRLANICVRYESLALDGEVVRATGVVIDTATGQDLRALLAGGIAVGVSSNGIGSARYMRAAELGLDLPDPEAYIEVIQDDFRLLTIDMVSDPSDLSGEARPRERRQRPAPTRPQEGTMKWNQKVKKAAERLGLTVEAFVEAHKDWADELQQEGMTPTAPAAAQADGVTLEGYRALEQTVVGLQGTVNTLNTQLHNAERDGIAITALEAARLPSSGKVGSGDAEIDLDASFRVELIQAARTAESAEAAQAAVAGKITARRAILGQRESAAPKRGGGRIDLPTGDNSRTVTEQERRQNGGATRQFEGARSRSGLI
ncbi:hypothetical protein [uncultured Deinococcus sp.]|uniref:hypothetical protein n=1 Tax=uncultured Deinococcus sp. TaxID=158789 RepID=UPI002588A832|nr:hypothetical protein [uncultured Deinococcus sp.]